MFDLDETLWSNWAHIDANDMSYQPEAWRIWCDNGNAPAIESVCAVYAAAQRLGLAVFFISTRDEPDRCGTVKNLLAIGCCVYEQLLLMPNSYTGTMGSFKTATRAQLEVDGYCIIANIGDQVQKPPF